ncbi:MAG: VOC family protein [Cyanobacteria bacterium P01_H01_bin.119]
MNLRYAYTRLNVENFQACKAFYRDVLGLAVKFDDEMEEYVEFDTGSTQITLFNRQKLGEFVTDDDGLTFERHSGRIVLSFMVNDLDATLAELKNQGIELLNPPTQYSDRNFISTCFRDPDGNLIELEQLS